VLLDASAPMSEQDQRVIATVVEAGRAMVLAFNKWDLVDEDRRLTLEKEIDRELRRVTWAARVNVSALTGRSVQRLAPALDEALAGWETRVPTAELNAFIGDLVAATPPPVRGGKQPRVLFATQPGVAPPRFVLFTTGPLEASYRRFIERRLRERYGFRGTPIDISVKTRDRRR
jgi:GTPase